MPTYVTGDTHGSWTYGFSRIIETLNFLHPNEQQRGAVIILGDAGLNYYGGQRDEELKRRLSAQANCEIFCVHGNHEQRPGNLKIIRGSTLSPVPMYDIVDYRGGKAYQQKEFPDIYFGIDGEVYDFDGYKCLVIGGAYSIDKSYRLAYGMGWWPDEQPSEEIKTRVENKLASLDHRIDVILSHTVPYDFRPVEDFIDGIDQSSVDTSTEEWLQYIYDNNHIGLWLAGHYYCDKWKTNKLRIMYRNIASLDHLIRRAYQCG